MHLLVSELYVEVGSVYCAVRAESLYKTDMFTLYTVMKPFPGRPCSLTAYDQSSETVVLR